MSPLTVLSLLLAVASAEEFSSGDFPHARLSNGKVELVVYLPDNEKGFYRGVRFDRSAFVAWASFKGHTWFGSWQEIKKPDHHDNVMGTAGEFGMGINGMSPPLGFAEAKEGEPFLKIGVGVLAKGNQGNYLFYGHYKVVRAGEWKVKRKKKSIECRQEVRDINGYGYLFTKRIKLMSSGFTIEHVLQNIGLRPIVQTYYSHNFIKIDDHPIGPDYRITYPYEIVSTTDLKDLFKIHGKVMTVLRRFSPKEAYGTEFKKHDLPASHNAVLVENTKTGAALRINGDSAISRYHFFAIGAVVCPEPFVTLRIAPGKKLNWSDTYDLIVKE